MRVFATIVACCCMGLTGCAVNMEGAGNQKPIAVGAGASKRLLLGMDGSAQAKADGEWGSLTAAFRDGCREEASAAGVWFEFQDSAARPSGEAGTLVAVYVNGFRYISAGERVGLGVMTGNAFIDASAKFLDLSTGELWGERPYKTKSSAWEGIGSAMTAKQAHAICKDMIGVVHASDATTKKR